jgi:uncharacterized protein
MPIQAVRFPAAGADVPSLEGELWIPDETGAVPGVVVAHPHPQRGGTMHNNVVMALCEGLHAAGMASLRFNFRGVGDSGGAYDDGVGERQDVLGALNYLAENAGIDSDRVGLAGYSFGARVSLTVVPEAPSLRALLCVAPPLRERVEVPCPFAVIIGDRDQNLAVGADVYASYLPDPTRLSVISGTDHFWRGFESMLVDAAREFFSDVLAAPRAKAAS